MSRPKSGRNIKRRGSKGNFSREEVTKGSDSRETTSQKGGSSE